MTGPDSSRRSTALTKIEVIATANLTMRPITMDDVGELVALDSDPEVMRYLSGGRASSAEQVATLIRERLGACWMAYDAAPKEFVGWFDLVPTAADEYELGYRLRRRAWGRGLATEGALALIEAAFTQLGAQRVWAETMAVNRRSRGVMERCGMSYLRTFHLDWAHPIKGTEFGEVEYELLRPTWEGRKAGKGE